LDSIDPEQVARLIDQFRQALSQETQVFVFGNGGSAANASHFVTDLGKGASDKIGKRFRCFSLNDNVSWMTALGNDYSYEDVFLRQLLNFAKPGDIVLAMSVRRGLPKRRESVHLGEANRLKTIALVGAKQGSGGTRRSLSDH
jgi:D-sedoheptulose 7-phosphate isomerase